MFTTVAKVEEYTGYAVDQETVIMAQAIIEAYVGRLEPEVNTAHDLSLLERATAYQAAYMRDNKATVFEQISLSQVMQFGQMMTFKQNDIVSPWVAPLAVLACQRLSWKRIRSVRTGSIYYTPPAVDDWRTD